MRVLLSSTFRKKIALNRYVDEFYDRYVMLVSDTNFRNAFVQILSNTRDEIPPIAQSLL